MMKILRKNWFFNKVLLASNQYFHVFMNNKTSLKFTTNLFNSPNHFDLLNFWKAQIIDMLKRRRTLTWKVISH